MRLALAQLNTTARQFSSVRRAVYSFEGDRHAFYEWLQRGSPSRELAAGGEASRTSTHRWSGPSPMALATLSVRVRVEGGV